MTIINIEDLGELSNENSLIDEVSLEARDSLKDSPYTDGSLDTLKTLTQIKDRIVSRGSVCRADILELGAISNENSILANHLNRYPAAFYTESLSTTLFDETVESMESSVLKTMSETLSTVTKFIGDHGGSAIEYIKEVFDEDARTNASIRKVNVLVDYLEKSRKILESSAISRKLSNDLKYVDETLYDDYTGKWNGLKTAMSLPEKEMAMLSEYIALPVIDAYPKAMASVTELVEGLTKAKTQEEVSKFISGYKSPSINIAKLKKWVEKHVKQNQVTKTEGIISEFQSIAMTVRSHIKALRNDRASKVPFKFKDAQSNMANMEWVTTKVVAEDILSKASNVAKDQDKIQSEMHKLASSMVVDGSIGQAALPHVLELLSITRGFGALIDAIGIITIVKRELINEQLQSLSKAVSNIHTIIKDKRHDLTVGEVSKLNQLIKDLKENL